MTQRSFLRSCSVYSVSPFVKPFPVQFALEIEPESELLSPLRTLGQRQPELRRLQAALIAQPVVGVEDVEHFPERSRRSTAESEDLADSEVGALLRGAAARSARLGPIGERIG